MKILSFAATNSTTSINKQLVAHAGNVFQNEFDHDAEIELIDLNDYEMPIYSPEREANGGVPALAQELFDKIGAADALLISYAEYNGFYTSAFKNIFDWMSRIKMKVYQDKPMVIMSASIGPNGGANVLKVATESAPFFAADIKGSFSVGPFAEKFDQETAQLIDAELAASLRKALGALHTLKSEAA